MNVIITPKRKQVIAARVEGNRIRATVRMTGEATTTVVKLLADVGTACASYQGRVLRGLSCKRVQCDEFWSFCYAKAKNVPADKKGEFGYGDVWTWVVIDADRKLVLSWLVGLRDGDYATEFMQDVASRLAHRVQPTTDGHNLYLEAVEDSFGGEVDYAMLQKIYDTDPAAAKGRYSPAVCLAAQRRPIVGNANPQYISTSYAERQNLTMRMSMRRFTRLTNGFSKKVEKLEYAVALHFMHYNFCRIHQSLRGTPAMEAGVTDRLWEIEDILALLESEKSNCPTSLRAVDLTLSGGHGVCI